MKEEGSEQFDRTVGARVFAIRRRRGLTQKALAEAVGQGRSYISHIEGGRTSLTALGMTRIASALGVSVDVLLGASAVTSPGVWVDVLFRVQCGKCGPLSDFDTHEEAEYEKVLHARIHAHSPFLPEEEA